MVNQATSALDTQFERLLQSALDKASIGRTTIVVAYRLSIIVNAGMIVFLDNGFITEHGYHNELLKNNGVYGNLVNIQTIHTVEDNNNSLKSEN